jgi:hypothetical protein
LGARVAPWALAGAACLAAPAAHADDCVNLHNPVFVTGSSAANAFIGKLAAALQTLPDPINIVYQSSASCNGVKAMLPAAQTPLTITGTGNIYDSTGTAIAGGCALDATGQAVDIGVSDVWQQTCGLTPASDVKEFKGPIQSMNFVVPTGSSQSSISRDAAYLIFGFGAAQPVLTWTDPTYFEVRVSDSGTLRMTGAAIGVDGVTHTWFGNANAGGSDVVNKIATDVGAGKTDQTIGILSSGDADKAANLPNIKKLAYQHTGQDCGYTVDSDSNAGSHDKRNVRDGHYFIWGPMHLFAHVDTKGVPTNAQVAKILGIVTNSAPVADNVIDFVQVQAKASVVPECAMRVYRDSEAGELSSYMPKNSCSCKWETEANGKPPECVTCTADTDCTNGTTTQDGPINNKSGHGVCSHGYCEVQ